jgi:DNA-binding XRE family transcriptional regulator
MNLNQKIVNIINASGVSNTKFADIIEVSRPTISHILSGRNKPSIDIIQKIMVKFPELGHKWFLDDEDIDNEKLNQLPNNQSIKEENKEVIPASESFISTKAVHLPSISNSEGLRKQRNDEPKYSTNFSGASTSNGTTEERKSVIEKIVIHYTDGSMEILKGGGQLIF